MAFATRSECGACGEVFAGLTAFDAHRTGSFSKRERRCLSTEEMHKLAMTRNEKGWWMLPPAQRELLWSSAEVASHSH